MGKLPNALFRRLKYHKTKHIDYYLDLHTVFLAHGGKCQECGVPTVLGVYPQVDNSATMEHIVPLSQGGNHVRDNVTLLCYKCNNLNNHNEQVKQNIPKPLKKEKCIFSVKIFSFIFTIRKEKK